MKKNYMILIVTAFVMISGCTKKEAAPSPKGAAPQAVQNQAQAENSQNQGEQNPPPAVQPVVEEHQTGIQGKIAAYMRKAFNIPPNVNLSVSEIKASDVPGLDQAVLTISQGDKKQTQEIYLSKDHKHLFMGKVLNLEENPFKETLSKVTLAGSPSRGPEGAKVTMVEFTDFECPFCGRAYGTVEDLLHKYSGRIRLVYKSFPLPMHPWAMTAAIGADCAYAQSNKAFWYFYNHLFQEQGSITPAGINDKLDGYAKAEGLNMTKFKACVDKQQTKGRVQADIQEGSSIGVTGTPTFVINGRVITGAQPEENFEQTINGILK